MKLPPLTARRRLLIVLSLTLLPWPAVWLGMYKLDSLVWTFFLYHGLCLLPAAVWGRPLWRHAVRPPTRPQWTALAIAIVCVLPLALMAYARIGTMILTPSALLSVVTERGFRAAWLWPLGIYFVPVNAVLEELFWRGVVLNELRGVGERAWTAGAAWTACTFAAWHYLVIHLLLRHGWAELVTVCIVGAGVFLAWLYRRTRSIIVPILWHALVFDLAIWVVFSAVLKA